MSTKEAVITVLLAWTSFFAGVALYISRIPDNSENSCESMVFENTSKSVTVNSSGQDAIVLGMNGCKDGEYSIKIGYKDYNYQSVVLESEVTYK